MEFNEDRQLDPIGAEPENTEQIDQVIHEDVSESVEEIVSEPVQEIIEETVAAPAEPEPAPVFERTHTPQPEEFTVPKKRKSGGMGKRLISAVLTVALVAGACAVTASTVNNRWEAELSRQQAQVDDQIAALQAQIEALAESQSGMSISGSPVATAEGLSPSQVYAMNVGSVVAISNQSTTNVWGQVSETASSGTGFIISPDGYILSNYHVVEGASRLTVMTYMGDEYEAKLVGYDQMNDVAILKVEAAGLDAVAIGSSDDLIVGDQVVAIGNPLGELTSSLTVGYIHEDFFEKQKALTRLFPLFSNFSA